MLSIDEAKANDYGRLSVLIQFKSSMTASDTLYINHDVAFPISSSLKLVCYFEDQSTHYKYYSSLCFYNSLQKRIEVKTPSQTTINTATIYLLVVSTSNDEHNALKFPSNPIAYSFSFYLMNSSLVSIEQFSTTLLVAQSSPNHLCFRNFLSNPNNPNI